MLGVGNNSLVYLILLNTWIVALTIFSDNIMIFLVNALASFFKNQFKIEPKMRCKDYEEKFSTNNKLKCLAHRWDILLRPALGGPIADTKSISSKYFQSL